MVDRVPLRRLSARRNPKVLSSVLGGLRVPVPTESPDVSREEESSVTDRTSFDRAVIYKLWDEILDILFERVERRYVPKSQVKHLVPELRQLLSSAKGQKFLSNSVVSLIIVMMDGDATVRELKLSVHCSESTIYRALAKLARIGFVESTVDGENARRWTIGRKSFPILYCASRP